MTLLALMFVLLEVSCQMTYVRSTNTLKLNSDTAATKAYSRTGHIQAISTVRNLQDSLINKYTRVQTRNVISDTVSALKAASQQLATVGFIHQDTIDLLVTKTQLQAIGGGGSGISRLIFKVGTTTGAPANGENTLQHNSLIGTHVEVWRGTSNTGLFYQYEETTNGIAFNSTTGTVTFYPNLATGERVVVQAMASSAWSELQFPGGILTLCSTYFTMNDAAAPVIDAKGDADMSNGYRAPTYSASGKLSTALNFAGWKKSVRTVAYGQVNPYDDEWSISFWVKLDSTAAQTGRDGVIIRGNLNAAPWYSLSIRTTVASAGGLTCDFRQIDDINVSVSLPAGSLTVGNWFHVVCVANGVGVAPSIYLNGTKTDGSTAQSYNLKDAEVDYTIGNAATATSIFQNLSGTLDEIGFFDAALSQSQVNTLYNSGTGLTYPF